MADYIYTRELDDEGRYNINNSKYVDGEGNMIDLCQSLKTIFPAIKFNMVCSGPEVRLISDVPLDGSQQATLTSELATYKAQIGE